MAKWEWENVQSHGRGDGEKMLSDLDDPAACRTFLVILYTRYVFAHFSADSCCTPRVVGRTPRRR